MKFTLLFLFYLLGFCLLDFGDIFLIF